MKKLKLIGILGMVLFLAGASVAGAGTLYMDTWGDGGQAVRSLYTVTTAGAATKVGDIKYSTNGGVTFPWKPWITDIAYNGTTGVMYAIGARSGYPSNLYYLDFLHPTPDGVVKAYEIGTPGGGLRGLAVDAAGVIYAGSTTSGATYPSLYTLDSGTGAKTLMDEFGKSGGGLYDYLSNFGDLAFSSSGTLYGTFYWPNHSSNNYLATVVPSTGVGVVLGGSSNIYLDGLAFGDTGTLYAVDLRGHLLTLNAATGAVITTANITVGGVGFSSYGYGLTEVSPPVPLPPTVLLLGSGLLGLWG